MDLDKFIVSEEKTLLDAMKKIDQNARKQLFVIKEGRLIAALSDGDVRRWLLRGGSLDALVRDVANYKPKYVKKENRTSVHLIMESYQIDMLPIVDEKNNIVEIVFRNERSINPVSESLANIPVVIMAGGLGTRLYPYTKILPKPLLPIGEIPITEHIMNQFRRYGCREFYMIVNHKKNMIKAYYNEIEKDYTIHFIDEDEPLGTGGGVRLLRGKIQSTFILTNCDTLIQEDYNNIVEEHKTRENAVTMICALRNFDIPYGIVEIGPNGTIGDIKEKPHYSFFTNTGTYIVEPEVIEGIAENEKIGFPDIVQRIKRAGNNVGVYPINEKSWLDMGQFSSMEEMRERIVDNSVDK